VFANGFYFTNYVPLNLTNPSAGQGNFHQ
jgi:hypothetical protein